MQPGGGLALLACSATQHVGAQGRTKEALQPQVGAQGPRRSLHPPAADLLDAHGLDAPLEAGRHDGRGW